MVASIRRTMASLMYACVIGLDGATKDDASDASWAAQRVWARVVRALRESCDWRVAFAMTKELYMGDED
jgi:hypothetical protein